MHADSTSRSEGYSGSTYVEASRGRFVGGDGGAGAWAGRMPLTLGLVGVVANLEQVRNAPLSATSAPGPDWLTPATSAAELPAHICAGTGAPPFDFRRAG